MTMPYVWHPSQPPFQERPPYASERVYDSKGFAIPAEPPHWAAMRDSHRHGGRVEPEKDAYWRTQLKDNPLGLDLGPVKETSNPPRPPSARPPSRSQSHPHVRNSYPPKASGHQRLASTTYPNTRETSPAYPRQHNRDHHPEVANQSGQYGAQSVGVDYESKRQRGTTPVPTHRDKQPSRRSTEQESAAQYDRAYGVRPSIPANAGEYGEPSSSGYDYSRTTPVKNEIQRRVSSAKTMARSKTMPVRSSRDADLEVPSMPMPRPYRYGNEPSVQSRDFATHDYLNEPTPQGMDTSGDLVDRTRVREWVNAASEDTAKRHTVDGLEHMRPEEHYSRRTAHDRAREQIRHGSAPVAAQGLPGSGRVAANGIYAEPEEMGRYRDRAPVDDTSSSGSESEDEFDARRPSRGMAKHGTPHPSAARRLTADHDDNSEDLHRSRRSSPRSGSGRSSGRQSARTSVGKRSFERERAVAEKEPDAGEESSTSYEPSIFAKGPAFDEDDDSDAPPAPVLPPPVRNPVTPERSREYSHRAEYERAKSPYASVPGVHHHQVDAASQTHVHGYSSASSSAKKLTRTGIHDRSPSYQVQPQAQGQTPNRLAYLYRGQSASPSPQAQGHSRSASVQPQQASFSSAYANALDSASKPKRRSPRTSRSPSPYQTGAGGGAGKEYPDPPPTAVHPHSAVTNGTPTRHGHSYTYSSASGFTHTHETPTSAGRRRSASRAGSHPPLTSHASHPHAIHPHTSTSGAPATRHVRTGLWNRRGDHLTETGYVVYCPPGRNYPPDLADYPDNAFMDHYGKIAKTSPDKYPELPESVPRSAGRQPERSYDSFIKYVLVPTK